MRSSIHAAPDVDGEPDAGREDARGDGGRVERKRRLEPGPEASGCGAQDDGGQPKRNGDQTSSTSTPARSAFAAAMIFVC